MLVDKWKIILNFQDKPYLVVKLPTVVFVKFINKGMPRPTFKLKIVIILALLKHVIPSEIYHLQGH